ncbi:hypothetical protein VCR3J2_310276 [Vibrio coralliirubri]|nr:hypothetical protein VCR3J2_310276 [Vibrio coralliirubri]
MVVENDLLEAEIERLKSELEVKSSKLVAANMSLEQARSSQKALEVELNEKTHSTMKNCKRQLQSIQER